MVMPGTRCSHLNSDSVQENSPECARRREVRTAAAEQCQPFSGCSWVEQRSCRLHAVTGRAKPSTSHESHHALELGAWNCIGGWQLTP
jgi:hypothetical protein